MALRDLDCFIFDIGNVLLFFDRSRQMSQVASVTGLPESEIIEYYNQLGMMDNLETGRMTAERMIEDLRWISDKEFSDTDFKAAFNDIFIENKSMIDMMSSLKKKGKRILILSNTNSLHVEYMRTHYSFLDHADEVILSFQVKAMKPELKIFEEALRLSECAAERCVYMDDISEYASQASKLGINGIHYTEHDRFLNSFQQ